MMFMFLGLARKIQTILEELISFNFFKSCMVHLTKRDQHLNKSSFMKSFDMFLGETFHFPQGSKGLMCNSLQKETSLRISLFSNYFFPFFFFNIYSFIWLHQVLVAACGI